MRTLPLLLTAAMAFGAVAAHDVEVDPDHPCYDAETEHLAYDEQQVWFHESDNKVGNLAAPATWDTNAPEASVQAGAGAGALSSSAALADTAGEDAASTSAVFAGTFDGCINTVEFDIYSFDPTNRSGTSATAEPAAHNFSLSIEVDGYEVFSGGPFEGTTDLDNEGFGPNLTTFGVNLGSQIELYAPHFEGLEIDGPHDITVTIASWYANTGHSVYVWDTEEVPAGMTFNGAADTVFIG